MNGRDTSIDSIKGLAIIAVVTIHSTFGENEFFVNHFLDVFSKFGVPMFIFISGYLMYRQKEIVKNQYYIYMRKRYYYIGIPYFLMTLIIAIFTHREGIIFLKQLLTGSASVPYFFIAVIFQLYLMSKLVVELYEKNSQKLYIISMILILIYSGLFYLQLFFYKTIIIKSFQLHFPNYLVWFVLGIDFASEGRIANWLKNISNKKYIIAVVFSLACCLIEIKILHNKNLDDGSYIALSSIIWEFISVSFIFKNKQFLNNKLIARLGRNSFGIFLIHKPLLDLYFGYFGFEKIPQLSIIYMIITLAVSIITLKTLGLSIRRLLGDQNPILPGRLGK